MIKIILSILGGVVITLLLYKYASYANSKKIPENLKTLVIGDKKNIQVEIADNNLTRTAGLSGRENLPDDTGMLFIFPREGLQTFWMKDMKFSLDFIWISQNKIVDIIENVAAPGSFAEAPKTVTPKQQVIMVLEVPAGFVQKNNIQIGDQIKLIDYER